MMLQATADARYGRHDAAEWIAGHDSQYWADLLGLEHWPPPVSPENKALLVER